MSDDDEAQTSDAGTQRLDKWLWYTRIIKSRTLAAGLINDGKVRLNRQRVAKPGQAVRIGDVVTATVHQQVRVLKVLAPGVRRGPPAEARTLYEDLTEPAAGPGQSRTMASRGPRPDKRQRRELAALKRGEGD